MALSPQQIDAIAAQASGLFAGGSKLDAVVRAVKEANPGLSVTGALTSVMADEPYREEERFSLFLVDNSKHCWLVTATPEAASAIVIAERDEDE